MVQNQAYLFLVFSLTGVVIGILFDFFRILRRIIKTSNIITYIEDVLFWVAIILGILIYMSILSNILITIFTKILQTIIKVLELPFKIIVAIFKKIITIISQLFSKITKKIADKKGIYENNGE